MSRPFRYTFILGLVALATGLAAFGGWRYARASAPVNGPIILISVDSLRADRLPAYGYDGVVTPAIDALAADGVLFERAYSHVPQTLPAHASLLTGQLPFEHGVRDAAGFTLGDRTRLVAEMLRDRGFATGAVVSSYELRKATGIAQGFDRFDDDVSAGPTEIGAGLWRSGEAAEARAEEWLEKAGTERAFLFLHLNDLAVAPLTMESSDTAAAPSPYDAAIVKTDAAVGRFIAFLKSKQLYDRSTIVLVADHGESLDEHGEHRHGLFVHEAALRVPLIIKQAAGAGAGRRVNDPVQHIDIVPTLLDFAKAPREGQLSGRSLVPLFEPDGRFPRRVIYGESLLAHYRFGWSGLATLTDGTMRYVAAPREELYNLAIDPAQAVNLAETDPAVDAWRRDLQRVQTSASPRTAGGSGQLQSAPAVIDNEVEQRLVALGHLGRALPRVEVGPLVDPKDGVAAIEARRAVSRDVTGRHWPEAILRLRTAIDTDTDPDPTDLRMMLAGLYLRAGLDDQAVGLYRRVLASEPHHVEARLAAAGALLRLKRTDEARTYAAAIVEASDESKERTRDDGTEATPKDDAARRAARMLLVEIALARHDAPGAREQASLVAGPARQPAGSSGDAGQASPVVDYVEARLHFDRRAFAEALPLFTKLTKLAESANTAHAVPDVRYYLGRTLEGLDRDRDAEAAFVAGLKTTPESVRTRAALAELYARTDRPALAREAIETLTEISPTPDAFRLSARVWESLDERVLAEEARAAARRLSAPKRSPQTQASRR